MKAIRTTFSALAISTALIFTATQADAATASASMHYGAPLLSEKMKSSTPGAITINNYTPNAYYVSAWFTDGSSGLNWVLGPQSSPTGIITIDNNQTAEIEVSNTPTAGYPDPSDDNLVFGPTWVSPGHNINIGPYLLTGHKKATVKVSVN